MTYQGKSHICNNTAFVNKNFQNVMDGGVRMF